MITVSKDCIQHVSFSSGYNVLICLDIAAVMDQRALWFALFLPLSLSFDTEGTVWLYDSFKVLYNNKQTITLIYSS